MKPSDSDAVVACKDEMMSEVNEALKKAKVGNARVKNRGTLVVEVSSENDRESAFSRLKEGFSNYYVIKAAKVLLQKFIVVEIPSDIPGDEIVIVICKKKYEQLNQLVESGKTLEVVKCWYVKNNAGDIQHK